MAEGTDGRMVLKWTFEKGVKEYIGLNGVRIGSKVGLFGT
jgi:hypothetical protein